MADQKPGPTTARDDGAAAEMATGQLATTGTAGLDSRMNVRVQADAKQKRNITRLLYLGRKSRSGRVIPTVGEHIDVIVPDDDNEAAAEEYANQAIPGALALTDEQKTHLDDVGLTPEHLQVSGQGYHFVQGETSDVFGEHVGWLKAHKTYAFQEADKD